RRASRASSCRRRAASSPRPSPWPSACSGGPGPRRPPRPKSAPAPPAPPRGIAGCPASSLLLVSLPPVAAEYPDLDVAVGDLVAVVLEGDLTLFQGAELLEFPKLAPGHPALPVAAAELERHHLLAVEPVLDPVAVHHNPPVVPRADRPRRVLAG